jgi:hypothetical protein
MKRIFLISAAAAMLIFNSPALADSIMCKEGVVNTGNNKDEVQRYCGNPLSVTPGENDGSGKPTETWRYAIGGCYRDFYFSGNRLDNIKDSGLVE